MNINDLPVKFVYKQLTVQYVPDVMTYNNRGIDDDT